MGSGVLIDTAIRLLAALALVVANAGFVAAEFALVAVDRARIDERAGQGQARAVAVQRLLGRLSYHLSGAQLGITITSLLLGVLAEPAVGADSRLSVDPGNVVGHTVSCTGSQYCGLAMIETKQSAERVAKKLDALVAMPRPLRIHWTGCPNSCGQVQAADIGLMGGPAKKMNAEGKMKAVPGVKVFLGGTIGEHGELQLEAEPDGIPIEDLVPHLVETIVVHFGGAVKPEYADEHAAWQEEHYRLKAAAKAAKK